MVGLAGFDSISMTGSVSGQLPATIRNGTIRIEDGRLESDGPGGVIRYGAGEIADDVSETSVFPTANC